MRNLGNFEGTLRTLGTFTWEPGNLYLGTWEPLLGNLYLGTFTWNLGTLGESVLELLRSAPKPLLWLKTPKHSAVGEKGTTQEIPYINWYKNGDFGHIPEVDRLLGKEDTPSH